MSLGWDELLRLVAEIYESAGDRARWPTFLASLGEATRATKVNLLIDDLANETGIVTEFLGAEPRYLSLYAEYYSSRDVWARRAVLASGETVPGEGLIANDELTKTEFYADFLRPQEIFHSLAGRILREPTRAVDLVVMRPKDSGPFGEEEEGLFRALMPHLQRAAQIHRRLAAAELTSRALAESMDRLLYGVILLDDGGRILLANRAARRLLAARDGLTDEKQVLGAAKRSESAILQRLIGEALDAAAGRGLGSGGVVSVSRRSGGRPLSLLVAPFLGGEPDLLGRRHPAVVVFVSDPDRRMESPSDALVRLYGLSPAEARVAVEVLEGGSLADIAERLGVTRNTANTHLKHVFEKTDTRRQSDLVRLLVLGAATFARK